MALIPENETWFEQRVTEQSIGEIKLSGIFVFDRISKDHKYQLVSLCVLGNPTWKAHKGWSDIFAPAPKGLQTKFKQKEMLDIVIEARSAAISEEMKVKRILPFRSRRMVGPFIFMDHAGPVIDLPLQPSKLDVLPHPHIGLSTVSYLFGGQVTHRDSLGVEQVIRPGEVNWMTAGRGIAHSERFEDPSALSGGLEMIQTWVALPEKDEEATPSFNNYTPEQLPVFTDKGVWMRLIAGNAYGLRNDVKTSSPLFYLHVVLQQGATFGLPKEHSERGFYIVNGSIEVSGTTYSPGKMLVFSKGVDPLITAKEKTTLMLLGGEPLGERYIWWNFVSSRKERIEQAKEDWKQGRIILPPNDDKQFIPLPDDKSKPAGSAPKPEPLS